jgi:peroxiredoxin Q/BCP
MNEPKVGRKIPSRLLPPVPKGKSLVLYFYPKDLTSGCTAEGLEFKALHRAFTGAGAVVRGVSRDSDASHAKFRAKHGFPFELIADEASALCDAFGVIKLKSLYGRKYLGIERSTFLIAKDGTLVREWRKVTVAGHAAEVLEAVRGLRTTPKPKSKTATKSPTKKTAARRRRSTR